MCSDNAFLKDVAALERLVNASIVALRNAASSTTSETAGTTIQSNGNPSNSFSSAQTRTQTGSNMGSPIISQEPKQFNNGSFYRPPGVNINSSVTSKSGDLSTSRPLRSAPPPPPVATNGSEDVKLASSINRFSRNPQNGTNFSPSLLNGQHNMTQNGKSSLPLNTSSSEDAYNRIRNKYTVDSMSTST
jgi:hypothetical protein